VENVVLDIETTGWSRELDTPIEISYLKFNGDMTKVKDKGTLHLYKSGIHWTDEAEAKHGLTREYLSQFESQYSENLRRLYKLVYRSNLIGHNIVAFDFDFIKKFLRRELYGDVICNKMYDTMYIYRPEFGKNMQLGNLTYELGATDEVLSMLHNLWFGEKPRQAWHSSTYDVTATTFCFLEAIRRNLVELL
jgi:DNA polymerase III epsilon subunit-like protein